MRKYASTPFRWRRRMRDARVDVLRLDRLVELQVLRVRALALRRVVEVDLAPLARHQVEHVDEAQQHVVVRRRDDRLVELGVQVGERLRRRRWPPRSRRGSGCSRVRSSWRAAQAGQAHRLALEHAAQLDRLRHLGRRRAACWSRRTAPSPRCCARRRRAAGRCPTWGGCRRCAACRGGSVPRAPRRGSCRTRPPGRAPTAACRPA